MAPPGVKRPPTVDDRDVRKPYTPAKGTELQAVPEAVDAKREATGVLQGEALAEERGKRPPGERFVHIEKRLDDQDRRQSEVIDRLGKVEVTVAGVGGQMQILPKLVESLQDATKAMQAREQVTLTAQVQVDTAKKVGDIEANTAKREVGWKLLAAAVPALIGGWEVLKAALHHFGVL